MLQPKTVSEHLLINPSLSVPSKTPLLKGNQGIIYSRLPMLGMAVCRAILWNDCVWGECVVSSVTVRIVEFGSSIVGSA